MVVVRRTRKLLNRLGRFTPCEASTTTVLGEWYATILFTKPRQVVLPVLSINPQILKSSNLEYPC